jgi:hypothetical protein
MNVGAVIVMLKLLGESGLTKATAPPSNDLLGLPIGYTGLGLPPPEDTPSGQVLTEEQKRALRG